MQRVFQSLLSSNTPLDATQKDSLEQLLQVFPLPENANAYSVGALSPNLVVGWMDSANPSFSGLESILPDSLHTVAEVVEDSASGHTAASR